MKSGYFSYSPLFAEIAPANNSTRVCKAMSMPLYGRIYHQNGGLCNPQPGLAQQ
jgi:hypothetical protein